MTDERKTDADEIFTDELFRRAAALQPQIDALDSQVMALSIAVLALALATTMMAVQLWRP